MGNRGKGLSRRVTDTVDILLATYNGARFLPEQLASIEAQTHRDWYLIARDDGSIDGTQTVVEEFAQRHPGRVRILHDGRGRLGVCGNFAALMAASDAPFFMFCDQDDIWLPGKIADLLGALREAEGRYMPETPILVHSDLVVVDEQLHTVHPSFWRYSRLFDPAASRHPARVMFQNVVTGCASIGNAALRRTALPVPSDARMHDWWVALVAAMLGQIAEHESPTILYRQHGRNEIGARSGNLFDVALRAVPSMRETRLAVEQSQRQAAAFARAFGTLMSPDAYRLISEFASLRESTLWKRKSFLFRHRLWPDSWLHSAAFWWFL